MFAERFNEALAKRGLRMADVANGTGMSKGSMTLYAQGKRVPTYESIMSIARFMRVNPMWLMDASDEMDLIPTLTITNMNGARDDKIRKVASCMSHMTDAQVDAFLKLAESIASK